MCNVIPTSDMEGFLNIEHKKRPFWTFLFLKFWASFNTDLKKGTLLIDHFYFYIDELDPNDNR